MCRLGRLVAQSRLEKRQTPARGHPAIERALLITAHTPTLSRRASRVYISSALAPPGRTQALLSALCTPCPANMCLNYTGVGQTRHELGVHKCCSCVSRVANRAALAPGQTRGTAASRGAPPQERRAWAQCGGERRKEGKRSGKIDRGQPAGANQAGHDGATSGRASGCRVPRASCARCGWR